MFFDVERPAQKPTKRALLPSVRCTEEERWLLNREARRRGLSVSDLVRVAVKAVLIEGERVRYGGASQ